MELITEIEVSAAHKKLAAVMEKVEQVIIGKHEAVELVLLALVAGGHVLIEDVPGVGKTTLISSIAKSVECGFKRIQFTPDLMPSDITGFSVFNQKSGEFEFRPGAVMSNLILADEINRASAKTQASLLEAMEERQVTVDGVTYKLESPFMVLATQNPLESFGTYPLTEAQIDRFLLKLSIGYPSVEEEQKVIHGGDRAKKALAPVISRQELETISALSESIRVEPVLERYIIELVAATRSFAKVALGSSPRGSIALYRASKALALFRGRGFVLPDDIKYLAPYVLGHRLILNHDAKMEKLDGRTIIKQILDTVAVPL